MRIKVPHVICLLLALALSFGHVAHVWADLYINILAVNGTDEPKEKDIKHFLPKEIKEGDVIDAGGLSVDYDIEQGQYYLHGPVSLQAKETKTIKVRIRDLWKFDRTDAEVLKEQINLNIERIKDTEFYDAGLAKKDELFKKLDYIVQQQEIFADNIEGRIEKYRTYATDIVQIREDAISVKYWRSELPTADPDKLFNYIVEVTNDTAEQKKVNPKFYLPKEVRPEHIIDAKGFEVRFDEIQGVSYLTKEEDLGPNEKKRFDIQIKDIWNIKQSEIEGLKERTRKAFKLLERTEYAESANYLVKNIKDNLEKIEASQARQKTITEHISAYRANIGYFEIAEKDVQALEDLLAAVREELERSKLRNVLQKVRSFKSIADIAEAIFGTKPSPNTAWKIITGIVIFVGIFTAIHFAIWGRRSQAAKLEEAKKAAENKEGPKPT